MKSPSHRKQKPSRAQQLAAQWHAQALARHRAGRLDEALPLYREALRQAPAHIDSLHMLGVLQAQRGDTADAASLLGQARELAPDDVELAHNLGSVLNLLGRYQAALPCFEQVVQAQPQHADAWVSLSDSLRGLGRAQDALHACEQALAQQPGLRRARIARANALRRLNHFDQALAAFDELLGEYPDSPEALNDRGNVRFDLRRFDDALQDFDAALALRPGYTDAAFNRANTLAAQQRLPEACAAYTALLQGQPAHADAWNKLGATQELMGEYDAALHSYARARDAEPAHVMAHLNAGLCHLLRGEFSAGWPLYQWRWQHADARLALAALPAPLWQGEDLAGKRIFVLAEQGLGDCLQFARYVPLLAARGARVLLQSWPPLQALLGRLAGVDTLVPAGETPPDIDYCVALLDLPGLLGTTLENIPAATPYLRADPVRQADWQAQLGAQAAPRIGLVWSGNPQHSNDHKRSIPLQTLLPLTRAQASFISLQIDLRESDQAAFANSPLQDLRPLIRDFDDTAALLEQLDLLITVDTSVAHLAGALGRPTWLLLPAKPDWRWLLGRDDSPWYPGMRLFRQTRADDWPAVVDRVAAALQAWLDQPKRPVM